MLVLVAGAGTGGTLTGVGQMLKERKPSVTVIAVEPSSRRAVEPSASAVLSGGVKGPHPIAGIVAGCIPENLDTDVHDDIVKVDAGCAGHSPAGGRKAGTARRNLVGGCPRGRRPGGRPENVGKTIVVIIHSNGERYLSTLLFADLAD